jgi:endonuclease/exonuclease/phosphatase family metal-dependent hydrolase
MLRLATWNVLSGRTVNGGHDPEGLARSLVALDADVVALQEIDHLQARSGHRDQLADLVAALSQAGPLWTGHFLPTILGTPGLARSWRPATEDFVDADTAAYGIAVLSRLPVQSWHSLRWTSSWGRLPMLVPSPRWRAVPVPIPDEPRAALAAVVTTELGPVTVIGTHLSFLPGRTVHQLRALRRWAATLPAPRVLLGDLNLPGQLPTRLTGWRRLADVRTFPAHAPRVQLDHALADGLGEGVRSQAVAVAGEVSDHRAVVVDLTRQ